jgi:hypothetical protein
MIFKTTVNKQAGRPGLGDLCEALFEANRNIYEFENKKWYGRGKKGVNPADIDEWDLESRKWNEERSAIKGEIDSLLQKKFNRESDTEKADQGIFSVLPISLMIDMMSIEKIKAYDLKKKGDKVGESKANGKLEAIKSLIDRSIRRIASEKKYVIAKEARTFKKL